MNSRRPHFSGRLVGVFVHDGPEGVFSDPGEDLEPHLLKDRLLTLRRGRPFFRSLDREVPEEIGVFEAKDPPATEADAARCVAGGGVAEEELDDPEREPLLAHASPAAEEEDLGECGPREGAPECSYEPVASDEGFQAHGPACAARRAASRTASVKDVGSALPVPTRSKAVPWSGDVRGKGSPSVVLTPRPKASVLKTAIPTS